MSPARAIILGFAAWPMAAAMAQAPVPAIQAQATASSSATGNSANATASSTATGAGGGTQRSAPPEGWPPDVPMMSAPAPLDLKEKASLMVSRKWRDVPDTPRRDANGVVRWRFGVSQARVVCAPFQACDIELKPGESVNAVNLGDDVRWLAKNVISGGADGRTHHVSVTPHDAGLVTSMVIYTDQRTYTIRLVSVQNDYTPLTGFTYPDQDGSYSGSVTASPNGMRRQIQAPAQPPGPSYVDAANVEQLKISGDNPTWRPVFAYTDGRKTYIQFPRGMEFGESPSLLGINSDGGWFSSPSDRRVIYRWVGDRIIADTVMDKLKLILGVGSSQQQVTLARRF